MNPSFPVVLDRLRAALAARRRWDVPGLSIEGGAAAIDLSVPPDGLLHLSVRAADAERGPQLRIDLGPGALPPDTVLGLIARWRGPARTGIDVSLRTDIVGGAQDVAMGRFDGLDRAQTQVLLHEVSPREPATRDGARTSLILHVPARDMDATLIDIGGLHRAAPGGPPAPGRTLGQLARG